MTASRSASFALVALLCLAGPLSAQAAARDSAPDPRAVQPERPTVATHAHTVAPGYVEIEAGIEGDRYAAGRRAYLAPVVVKVGLASHAQLNLSVNGFADAADIGQRAGLGDVAAGIKWRLLDDDALLGDFAVLPAIKLPTGSLQRGTGTGTTDLGVTLISSRQLGPVAMDLNATYTRVGAADGTPASDAGLWTASFGAPLTTRLGWVVELFGIPTLDGSGTPSSVALLIGPTFLIDRALGLDAGVIAPLRGDRPNALYAGLVWNAGRLPFTRRE